MDLKEVGCDARSWMDLVQDQARQNMINDIIIIIISFIS